MSCLSLLNNELQTIMVVLLFITSIFTTIAMLCEMFSNHKIKMDLFAICRMLNIVNSVIWSFIFFNFVNTPYCEVIAYYSVFVIVFEIFLGIKAKNFAIAIDIPFLIMLLPFWKYISYAFYDALIVISVVYLFAKSLILLMNSLSKLKNNINYYSLKEALDGVKTAVMFESKYDVVYENVAMKNLLEKLRIDHNKGSFEIWKELRKRENSKVVDEQDVLVFLDDKVYSFSMIKQFKTQIYAFDITEEYLTTVEIENKQSELRIKQSEIIKMIDEIDEIERQKEVLILKSKLHDIIGQRLFILHHILDVIDEKNFDLNSVKQLLSTMLSEIDNDDMSEVKSMQSSITSAFEMIGFNIVIVGDLPNDIQKAKALIKIIRESATNAIRHANATKLFVNISSDRIEISDNGKFTEKSINEGTGIKGMRLNSQVLGGILSISTEKGFKIIINFNR